MYHGAPMGRGRGGSGRFSTDALLQRANSQLRGEKVSQKSGHAEEDELGAYLSGLSSKPTASPQNIQWDKFGEDDLSDDGDDIVQKQAKPAARTTAPSAAGSKFLKKKKTPSPEQDENEGTRTKGKAAGSSSKSAIGQQGGRSNSKSSALSKVAAFTNRYESKAQREVALLSESDMDLSLSIDNDVLLKDVQNLQSATSSVPMPRKTIRTPSPDTSSEGGLGKGGSRFLKKPKPTPRLSQVKTLADEEDSSSQLGEGGSKFLKKKTTFADEQPAAPVSQSRPAIGLKSAEKYSTQVVLDTDEESMAEYIHGMPEIPPVDVTTPRSPPKTPRGILKTPRTPRTPTPMEDITEEEGSQPSDEVASDAGSDDSFKINLLDLDFLEPAMPATTSQTKTSSKRKVKAKPKKAVVEQQEDDIFASMGLHTVDELLAGPASDADADISEASEMGGGATSEIKTEADDYQYESDFDPASTRSHTPLRSILSPTPRPTPRSSRSRVRYNLQEVKVRSRSPSPEVISTARGSYSHASMVYTEDFEDESASEVFTATIRTSFESDSEGSDGGHRGHRSRPRKDSDDYSDDFTSGTELTPRRHQYSRSSSHESDVVSYTESFTSYASYDSSSRSRTPSPDRKPQRVKTATANIQTGLDLGDLIYHWNHSLGGSAVQGPSYGLTGVDPSPIATHVVGADALEALTSYSPSVIALNDMLRQQIHLTTQFLESQRRLHKTMVNHMEPEFQYTTLEDTKRYIKKHRKKTLTFEEALKQVKTEMDLE